MGFINKTLCIIGAFYSLFIANLHMLRNCHRIYIGRLVNAGSSGNTWRTKRAAFQFSVENASYGDLTTGEFILGATGILLTLVFVYAIIRLFIGLERYSKQQMNSYVIIGLIYALWQFISSIVDLSRSNPTADEVGDMFSDPNVLSNPMTFRHQIEIGAGAMGLVALPVNIAVIFLVYRFNSLNGS